MSIHASHSLLSPKSPSSPESRVIAEIPSQKAKTGLSGDPGIPPQQAKTGLSGDPGIEKSLEIVAIQNILQLRGLSICEVESDMGTSTFHDIGSRIEQLVAQVHGTREISGRHMEINGDGTGEIGGGNAQVVGQAGRAQLAGAGKRGAFRRDAEEKQELKERVKETIRELAERLKRPPNFVELNTRVEISRKVMTRLFGSYGEALKASGVQPVRARGRLTTRQLFEAWAEVVRQVGTVPSVGDFERLGRHSQRPYMANFGKWSAVPLRMWEYAEENAMWNGWEDVKDIAEKVLMRPRARGVTRVDINTTSTTETRRHGELPKQNTFTTEDTEGAEKGLRLMKDLPKPKDFLGPAGIEEGRAVFGPPLVGLPMVMAPTNEDGVNFLFGWMAQKLGFLVLMMQSPFPDCIAMRRVDDETWQLVVIELEYESRNFIAHGHDPSKVDLIVCWKHDWEECPVEVVELSSFFQIG